MPAYIQKRRRRWYAVLEIPKALRRKFEGKSRFFQSLGTESQSEAEMLVLPVIARWKAELEAARTGNRGAVEDVIALALEFRQGRESDTPQYRDLRDSLIDDKARDLEWKNSELAETFFRIAHGQSVPLDRFVDDWLAGLQNEPKTKDMKKSDALRFAEEFEFSHRVDLRGVRTWAHKLSEGGLAPATVSRIISACRGYWDYLNRAGRIQNDSDPFERAVIRASTKSKSANETKRRPFADRDLLQVLQGAVSNEDTQLKNLIMLAIWTGCRIEEMCALNLNETLPDRFVIVDAKSSAGNRDVPIHSRLLPVVERLRHESTDGYLLSGLTQNKYGDRSNAIGKRFGRLRDNLGFDGRYVFHSIRKSVATEFENQGVPENVAADILGHEKKTLTYGTYSGGTSFEVKVQATEQLRFAALHGFDFS
ncbi:tyrosine-type recombinase/integrase [Ruegeria litorea]|uniref:Tyrosine-type recombinase/integrase n=1 Tax=Falsiruegeria litorea TaxID=1280831 RepID=A0ABS5WQG5_9RHOB|nr:tyrosine-type recombinase/integrase [Falsiruegeria litorea]MBT3141369.1 tyrosine-type recombinase/integrase [Falsiruegeria litorea]